MADDQDLINWEKTEYNLAYLLDNFPLPQMVRVVEGYMLTEDDSLASGTILTLHALKAVTTLKGRDERKREISIPLNCPNEVKLVSTNGRQNIMFHTVDDMCRNNTIPKYVKINRSFSYRIIKMNPGDLLKVQCKNLTKDGEASGIIVSPVNRKCEPHTFSLPLDTVGDFTPFMPQNFEEKVFEIKELSDNCILPFTVKFLSKGRQFGSHLGEIELNQIVTSEIVLATSKIDGVTYAVTFPRNLPVTIQVARGMLDNDQIYTNLCQMLHNEIDLNVIEQRLQVDPHAGYCLNTSVYDSFQAQQDGTLPRHNFDSNTEVGGTFPSDTSTIYDNSPRRPDTLPRRKDMASYSSAYELPAYDLPQVSSKSGQSPVKFRPKLPPPIPKQPPSYKRCPKQPPSYKRWSYTPSGSAPDPILTQSKVHGQKTKCKPPATRSLSITDAPRTPVTRKKPHMPTTSVLVYESDEDSDYEKPIFPKPEVQKQVPLSTNSLSDDDAYEEFSEPTQPNTKMNSSTPPPLPPTGNTEYNCPPKPPPKPAVKPKPGAKGTQDRKELKQTSGMVEENDIKSDLTRIVNQKVIPKTPRTETHETMCSSDKANKPRDVALSGNIASVVGEISNSAKNRSKISLIGGNDSRVDEPSPGNMSSVIKVSNGSVNAEKQTKKGPSVLPKPSKKKLFNNVHEYPFWVPSKTSEDDISKVSNTQDDGEYDVFDTTLSPPDANTPVDTPGNRDPKMQKGCTEKLQEIELSDTSNVKIPEKNLETEGEDYDDNSKPLPETPNETTCSEETQHLEFDTYQSFQSGELKRLDKNQNQLNNSEHKIKTKNEAEICEILDCLNLSGFRNIFHENQINGELIMELSRSDFVNELEMSEFQAMKLDKYIHGWLPDSMKTPDVTDKDSLDPTIWSSDQVHNHMKSLNLLAFAEFCKDNQINGELLKSILQENILDDIRSNHNIQVTKIDEKRLCSFVFRGWRPDSMKKGKPEIGTVIFYGPY